MVVHVQTRWSDTIAAMSRAFVALCFVVCALAAEPARILIITGESDTQYHQWRETTAFFERVLARTGRFDVRRVEDARALTPAALARYDAVIVNYNGPRWGSTAESALEEFVRFGKGLVSFHGVTYGPLMGTVQRAEGGWDAGEPWKAWSEMLGVTWAAMDIGHAPRHAFAVKLSGDHPVSAGMPREFTVNDELYHKMSHGPGVRVVATAFDDPAIGGTGRDEPVAWTKEYGKGRVFHCTLGHDTNALYSPEVAALVARSVEWAATGRVTLPASVALTDAPIKDAVRALVADALAHAGPPELLGDIALALETCAREAADKGVPLEHHATHLLIHGLLHLAGHDHELGPAEARAMEQLEIKALALLGIADPYGDHEGN